MLYSNTVAQKNDDEWEPVTNTSERLKAITYSLILGSSRRKPGYDHDQAYADFLKLLWKKERTNMK